MSKRTVFKKYEGVTIQEIDVCFGSESMVVSAVTHISLSWKLFICHYLVVNEEKNRFDKMPRKVIRNQIWKKYNIFCREILKLNIAPELLFFLQKYAIGLVDN